MGRAQLKHVLLDVDFFDKPTIRALGFRHSQISVLLFIRWMMLMSRATNGLVTRDAMASVAREVLQNVGTATATFESVMKYCIETEMIYEEKDGYFTNERVVKDQESCAVKRESSNERQKKFREKKVVNSNALLTRLPVTDTVTEYDTDNDLDLNSLELEIALPEFQNTETSTAIVRWARHQKKLGRGFDQTGVDSMLNLYRGSPRDLSIDIDHSILNGWKTLHAKPKAQARAGPKLSAAERNIEATKQALREIKEEIQS